jgi:RNA polymerase sigma-70 factor (ECF subfamily)
VPAFRARKSDRVGVAPEPTPLSVPLDDLELSERLAAGDGWAQEAFYRKYVGLVWGVSLRLMGNRPDAEDVLQDTFAEALRDAKQLRGRGVVRSWLMSVTVHQAHRRFRRRRLLRKLGLDRSEATETLDGLASPDTGPELQLELRKLGELLATLPVRRRIAWTLRYVEGCSLEEVAGYCGSSLATAKRDIAAAQVLIQAHVNVEFAAEAGDG